MSGTMYEVVFSPGIDMVVESLPVPLQFSVVPLRAARLFPVKVRVELMQKDSVVWLSMALTPETVSNGVFS